MLKIPFSQYVEVPDATNFPSLRGPTINLLNYPPIGAYIGNLKIKNLYIMQNSNLENNTIQYKDIDLNHANILLQQGWTENWDVIKIV